ncbi:MAG: branched-chain amino acid ABC transporter permease [Acetobacteraceae bacterium]|nr:branched-chain amino acid ABC transporter permease [Acetobacteraceae bacterium]
MFLQLMLPGFTTGCVYALVALGYVLCANVSGVVNFAQGEFVMLGGMTAAWLIGQDVDLIWAIAAAVALGAAMGAVQEVATLAPVRRAPHFIQITTTVGFAVVLRGLTLIVAGKDALSIPGFSGDDTFELAGAVLPLQSLWVWGATALLLAATFGFLRYTATGRAVRACSINLQAARLMGVDAGRLRLLVLAATGGSAALAGVVITPIVLASWDAGIAYSIKGFIGAILGGFRSPGAAVLGGIGIGLVESFASGYVSSGWQDFIVDGLLLAYLLLRGGILLRGRAAAMAGES